MLSLYFTFSSEWNNVIDLSKQAAVNGALENAPADGTITAHIQVMIIQSLNTVLFLILQVLLFHWFNGVVVVVVRDSNTRKIVSQVSQSFRLFGKKINNCCI